MKTLRNKIELELENQRREYKRQKSIPAQEFKDGKEITLAQYMARIDLLQRMLRKDENED